MPIGPITSLCNRALRHSFSPIPLLICYMALLAASGSILLMERVGEMLGYWPAIAMGLIGLFIASLSLLVCGVGLTRLYSHKLHERNVDIWGLFNECTPRLMQAPLFCMPPLAAAICCWLGIGLFSLLEAIPYLGVLITSFFSVIPMLLSVILVLLAVTQVLVLFMITPMLGLGSLSWMHCIRMLGEGLVKNPFGYISLLAIAITPILLGSSIVYAAGMLLPVPTSFAAGFGLTMRTLFLLVPAALVLSPTLCFFYNFSAEASVLLNRAEDTAKSESETEEHNS